MISRIPGKRTIKELAASVIPSRLYFVTAGLAVVVCIGMTLAAAVLKSIGPPWLAQEASNFAAVFRVMPLWFLVGGALSQVSTRLNIAIDDVKAYLASNGGTL